MFVMNDVARRAVDQYIKGEAQLDLPTTRAMVQQLLAWYDQEAASAEAVKKQYNDLLTRFTAMGEEVKQLTARVGLAEAEMHKSRRRAEHAVDKATHAEQALGGDTLTLRDRFACAALVHAMTSGDGPETATTAYEIADAMLKARSQK